MLKMLICQLVWQVSAKLLTNMEKEKLFNFKGTVKITKRKMPRWTIILEKLGLWKLALKFGKIVSIKEYNNLFCNVGRQSILDRMIGLDKGQITYLALGSNTVAPAITDVQLGTETFRKLITTRTRNVLVFESSTYIAIAEAVGTHKEIGLFGDDTSATTNSGTLFTHLSIDETKTNTESITIDYNIEALTT